jgi:hypothetical protein
VLSLLEIIELSYYSSAVDTQHCAALDNDQTHCRINARIKNALLIKEKKHFFQTPLLLLVARCNELKGNSHTTALHTHKKKCRRNQTVIVGIQFSANPSPNQLSSVGTALPLAVRSVRPWDECDVARCLITVHLVVVWWRDRRNKRIRIEASEGNLDRDNKRNTVGIISII